MENLVYREVDEDYRISKQAFRNFAVQAKKRTGKNKERPVYKTFRSFFDYAAENKKAKETIEKPKHESRFSDLSRFIKQKGGSDGKRRDKSGPDRTG